MQLYSYTVSYYDADNVDDTVPCTDSETTTTRITLTDNFGYMTKRTKEAIIRFPSFNKHTDADNWYRSQIMYFHGEMKNVIYSQDLIHMRNSMQMSCQ